MTLDRALGELTALAHPVALPDVAAPLPGPSVWPKFATQTAESLAIQMRRCRPRLPEF
jgi:hypothetical protein